MNTLNILNNEQAMKILKDAREALEQLGVACVLAPMGLREGMTISLHVGCTPKEAVAARVAAITGGASAHTMTGAGQFETDLLEALREWEAEKQYEVQWALINGHIVDGLAH